MLGKLLKHEWKAMCRIGGLMLLVMFAVTLIGCLVLRVPWIRNVYAVQHLGGTGQVLLTVVLIASFVFYVFLLMGITYGILIYSGVHFYRTMYSDRGYLTNTLPVTPGQLLFSKTFMAGIWYLFIEIGVLFSVGALILSLFGGVLGSEGITLAEIWENLRESAEYGYFDSFKGTVIRFAIILFLYIFVLPFCTVIMIFAAFTIGQLSRKNKAVMGILAYLGISFVNMILNTVVQVVYTLTLALGAVGSMYGYDTMGMMGAYDISLVITVAMAVILYVLSHFILSQKLNLE